MYSVGIDLGGTNIAAGVVDLSTYQIIGKASVPTDIPRPAESIADSIKQAALLAIAESNVTMDDIVSVGIGTPGAVSAGGVVEFAGNLGFVKTPLGAMVEERIEKKTFVGNDANCAGLAEQIAGCGNGCHDFIIVTLGTGVGGGIIIDGKIYAGHNFAGAELGHIVIDYNGRQCSCGRRGCFETYSSATGLTNLTREKIIECKLKQIPTDMIADSDNGNRVSARTAFTAMKKGDAVAKSVVDEYISYLACGLTNILNIFQPEVLSIGGGICNEKEHLLNPLLEIVKHEQYTRSNGKQPKIMIASLGNDAGIIGAAGLGISQ